MRGVRREKFQSHLKTCSQQNTEARKVSGRKTIQSQHCESQFVPGWTDFYLVPFKESRFSLFGISIQAGKRSSRSITSKLKDLARQVRQGLISFTKHERPVSSEDLEVFHVENQLGLNAPESFANLS